MDLGLSGRAAIAGAQADTIAIWICDPSHPAYACLDWFDEDFDAMFAANFDGCAHVVYRQRYARRLHPIQVGVICRAIETEPVFSGELTPKIIPLPPALKAKKLLVEGAGSAVSVIHHEIKHSNRNRRTA
jgi:hypothetical protein